MFFSSFDHVFNAPKNLYIKERESRRNTEHTNTIIIPECDENFPVEH